MVNSIEPYGDLLYIGSDQGLSCYRGKEKLSEDPLVQACKNLRVRQIYVDDDHQCIWVVTYQRGLIQQKADGEISFIDKENSELTTNSLRYMYEQQDGNFLIATEEGVFVLTEDEKIRRLSEDTTLNKERILSVAEDEDGRIYIGTDGDGIYVLEDGEIIRQITMEDGLFSNVILKIRKSQNMDGFWIVTGTGVSFISRKFEVSNISGVEIANSLDLLFLNEEEVAILAGNGFFRMKESELLDEKMEYIHYDKQLGLPIDFTANAANVVKDGVLYMCGTTGAACLNLEKEEIHREIRIYVKSVYGDRNNIYHDGQEITIDKETYRLNLDVRILNYTHENYDIRFMLEGADREPIRVPDAVIRVESYTNLKGGKYIFHYEVLEEGTEHVLAEKTLSLVKNYTLWESPRVRLLLLLLILCGLGLSVCIAVAFHDRAMKERYRKKYMKEHREELEKLAYQDMVTGISNRNCYERDRDNVNMKQLQAVSTVSINHGEYLRHKYGIRYFETILKKTVQILQNSIAEDAKIYRISEYVFCIWFEQPVDLEEYIYQIKESFKQSFCEEEDVSSLAVGAVYHDTILKEDYGELINKCEEMRMLDQKHEEMKFMDRKVQYMNIES